ncbi:uncharacterized protein LOC126687851 [Mercurialis annua]|uniref:uncharacterized protein LOC126687851 n=1 Tax=Mercurialis annua TaxID=3986 RepID=UPI002160E0BF|nr:uncharacterized protein LOC126687851 [Mercurialis annua]
MEVLENVHDDATGSKEKDAALDLLNRMENFEFLSFIQNIFLTFDLMMLSDQLEIYIHDVRQSANFVIIVGIRELTKKLVELEKYTVYPLIYQLIELALILPVSTASVEKAFSAMNIIKTDLRNKMGDEFLSDNLVCVFEKQIFVKIDDKLILQRFQAIKTRRIQLPLRDRN